MPKPRGGPTLLTNLHGRSRTSLDGRWKTIVDPYDFGYTDMFGEPTGRGYFRDWKPRHQGDRVEYDFDSSAELAVPGDWNTQRPELLYYEGTVWYRRTFEMATTPAGRSFVAFGAANHTARIFLDGEELAHHEGGFGPFAVEVTGRLGPGEHSLVAMVDNRRRPDRIPAMRADWWNFGGLTRSVELVEVPATFVRDAWLAMAPDGRIVGSVTIDGDDDCPVSVELPELGLGADLVDGRFEIPSDGVERWHPGRPVLHRVVYRAGDDVIEDEVGFRTVTTEGSSIVVNGEPVFLKGISIHGEGPSGGRRAHGPADAATLLDWAQDLGANFVRLAHYQHDEAMVREADRRGLLAWCELPVYWGIDFANPASLANGLDQTDELVIRDRSRASVILWSVANETPISDARQAFLGALIDRVRQRDPTRLVSAALLTMPGATHIDDPLGELVDVIGVNQYFGWYYGSLAELPELRWTSDFAKPVVFTELGAGAKAGHHGDPDQIWTEEHQAAVYDAQLAMIGQQDLCAGLSPWILKDFRTPVRVLPGIQDGYNRKGVVSEEGERKLAFDVLADWYLSR